MFNLNQTTVLFWPYVFLVINSVFTKIKQLVCANNMK